MKDETHFNKLFWFCVSISGFGLLFLVALVWVPIPKENVRFADVTQGFITGSAITAAISFLLGGSAPTKKHSSGGDNISDGDNVTITK